MRRVERRFDLDAWSDYMEANEAARRAYDAGRDTIDARYNVVNGRDRDWYERDVAVLNGSDDPA